MRNLKLVISNLKFSFQFSLGISTGEYQAYEDDYSYATYSSHTPFIVSLLHDADSSKQSSLFPSMKFPFGPRTPISPMQDSTVSLPMDLSQKYPTRQHVYHPFCFPFEILESLRPNEFSVTGDSGHSYSCSLSGSSCANEKSWKQSEAIVSCSFGTQNFSGIDGDNQVEERMDIQNGDSSRDYSIFAPQRASTPIHVFNSPCLEPKPTKMINKKRKRDDSDGLNDQENRPIKKIKPRKKKMKIVKNKPVSCRIDSIENDSNPLLSLSSVFSARKKANRHSFTFITHFTMPKDERFVRF